jgi:multicomponent K+:H+ antiporter subunit C
MISMEFLVASGIGFVVACGIYLLLRGRSFTVVLGLSLLGYADNVFIFAMGRLWSGAPPIIEGPGPFADPLPQALVLTAIVIGFALQAFLLALAWRSWTIDGNDDVEDDIEDRRLANERRRVTRLSEADRAADRQRALAEAVGTEQEGAG